MTVIKGTVSKIYLNERETAQGMKIGPVLIVGDKKISLPLGDSRTILIHSKELGEMVELKEGHIIAIKTEVNAKGYTQGKISKPNEAMITGFDEEVAKKATDKPAYKGKGNPNFNKAKSNYDPMGAMVGGCKHDAATIVAALINTGTKYSKQLFVDILNDVASAEFTPPVKEDNNAPAVEPKKSIVKTQPKKELEDLEDESELMDDVPFEVGDGDDFLE